MLIGAEGGRWKAASAVGMYWIGGYMMLRGEVIILLVNNNPNIFSLLETIDFQIDIGHPVITFSSTPGVENRGSTWYS